MAYAVRISTIIFGSMIFAVGINLFLVPFRVLDGGFIGLALIINYLTGIKVGFIFIILSIPIYIFAWFQYRSFFYRSVIGMLLSSLFIDFFYPYQFYFVHYIKLTPRVSSILGGIIVGIGMGLLLKNGTSISGSDMLAQIISKNLHINVGITILIFDTIIVCLGGLFISIETFYLSILTILAVGTTTSLVTYHNKLQH